MKKNIVIINVLVLVMALSISLGTYAVFTASTSGDTTSLTAAHIDIEADRDDGEPTPGPMFYFDNDTDGRSEDGKAGTKEDSYWYPGKVSEKKTLDVHNKTGSMAVKLVGLDAVVEDPSDDGVDDTLLKNALWITVTDPAGSIRWEGYLSDLTDGTKGTFYKKTSTGTINPYPFLMAEGESSQLIMFQASMPTDPPGDDNQYQGKNIKVQFRVYAEQQ